MFMYVQRGAGTGGADFWHCVANKLTHILKQTRLIRKPLPRQPATSRDDDDNDLDRV